MERVQHRGLPVTHKVENITPADLYIARISNNICFEVQDKLMLGMDKDLRRGVCSLIEENDDEST